MVLFWGQTEGHQSFGHVMLRHLKESGQHLEATKKDLWKQNKQGKQQRGKRWVEKGVGGTPVKQLETGNDFLCARVCVNFEYACIHNCDTDQQNDMN